MIDTYKEIEDMIFEELSEDEQVTRTAARRQMLTAEKKLIADPKLANLSEGVFALKSVTGQHIYNLPPYVRTIKNITFENGDRDYPVGISEDWSSFLRMRTVAQASSFSLVAFQRGRQLYFYPTPDEDDMNITIYYRRQQRSFQADLFGLTTAQTANKLVDSSASFTDELIGLTVFNESTGEREAPVEAIITAVDDANTLSLSADIFADLAFNEEYRIDRFSHYTKGAITTATEDDKTIVGTGTSWPTNIVGKYLKINSDGYWYRVASRTSDTELELENEWMGEDISGGNQGYAIAELPLLTTGHMLAQGQGEIIALRAVSRWFLVREEGPTSDRWKREYLEAYEALRKATSSKTGKNVFKENRRYLDPQKPRNLTDSP